jgi:hypothetical protein
MLQVQDLFAAGIGFDFGGAYLLGRGLIMSPRKLTLISGSYYGSNSYLGVSVAHDRLDAISGVGALLMGFALQLSGYLITLATTPTQHRGWIDALAAASLAGAALIVALSLGMFHRRLRIKPTLIEMSHFDGNGDRQDEPRGDQLLGWGTRGLGIPAEPGEAQIAYIKCVFGVSNPVIPRNGGGYEPMADN